MDPTTIVGPLLDQEDTVVFPQSNASKGEIF